MAGQSSCSIGPSFPSLPAYLLASLFHPKYKNHGILIQATQHLSHLKLYPKHSTFARITRDYIDTTESLKYLHATELLIGHSRFSLVTLITFYNIDMDTELVDTESPRLVEIQGSVPTCFWWHFKSTHQYITLFYVYLH